jgi:hypothetical protein
VGVNGTPADGTFVRPSRVLVLRFDEEHELYGMVARVRSLSLGSLLDLVAMASVADRHRGAAVVTDPEAVKAISVLFEAFVDRLVSWNMVDDDGIAVPATLVGLRTMEMDHALDLIGAWMDAAAGVSPPLNRPSSGGERYPEGSIPMEVLSPSLLN